VRNAGKQREARDATGRRLNKPLPTGSKRTPGVERSQRKFARTWRNFGHGGQGPAGQRGLSHTSVGGAGNLRKGRRSTTSALHEDWSTDNWTGQNASGRIHSVRQDDQNRHCSGANSDSPRKRASARRSASSRRHSGPSQELRGASPRVTGQRFRELQAEAAPQGEAQTRSAAKWSERPRAIGRKRSQPFSAPV